ncbi:ATP-binding protein [Hydrogenophaga sp. RWCD_12]|uniref:hybrid sensor histidine kinase/response regulator n=1 Tax=Hydrogenophaga sp. RWCD_12 TaxID=3391190 RepID=UPI003984CDAF
MAGDPSSAAPAPQRRRLSLGPSLIAALVLSALLPALLVSWLLSSNSSQAIDTLAENAISQAAHRVDVGALAHLGESHTVVNALVPPVTTSGAEAERTRNWLHDTAAFELMAYALTQQSPNVPYLYFGTTDGSFFGLEREEGRFVVREILPGDSGRRHYEITEPGDRSRLIKTETTVYDPRKRPWYQLAASTGKRVFTDVYRSAVKNQFDLTLAQPIFDADGKTLLGVMAVDMSLARLTDLIRSTRISDHAVTYLVDGQGRMVASSVDEDLSTLVNDKHQRITPLQSREALVRESYAQLFAPDRQASKGEQGLVRLETGSDWLQRLGLTSNRLIALHRPFGSKYQLDWQLVVVAPEQDFTAHVLQARQWALLAMAALIGFGALVAFLVARRLSAQFRRLNKAATLVGTGSVPPVQENAPFREVYNLSRVMHDSAAKLQAYNRAVKRKNKALREATLLLEERVRVRTAELATSREEALAAVKAKAGFLAVMSHEIRTPLNGVVGMSQLLGDTGLNRSQKELLGVLKVSSEQLLSVVDDILDFSKIESGKLSLEHLPMDLHAAIRGVCDIARLKSQEKGLQLRVDLRPDLPQAIVSDITRLRQVLLNLLSNAVKFTHHGDVTLRAWVEQAGDPMTLGFSVSDTGVGISPQRLGELFQPFSQGDTSTARVYGGTGLGLMICRYLVERMGGKIQVNSQTGVGSTFSFTIQTSLAQAGDIPSTTVPELRLAVGSYRLLVVDDNLTNLKVASAMLTRLGYLHDTRDNGLRAVEAVEQAQREHRPYALVLMDSHMPEMDGAATTLQIRERLGADAPIVLGVSASSLPNDRIRCLESGMSDYLAKPLELHTLGLALQRWLGDNEALGPETMTGAPLLPAEAKVAPWINVERWAMLGEFDSGAGKVRSAIVQDFLAELDTRKGEIHRAMAARDHQALGNAAHQLKGAALNTCASRLAQVCEALEMRSLVEDPEAFADDGSLDQVIQGTREALEAA